MCQAGSRASGDSLQPQTNKEVICNTVGAGVVCTSHLTAVLIKGGSLGSFTHRQSAINDSVRSQGSTRKSRERPRTNLP